LSDRLPDKLVSLDQVRINRGLEKICQCQKRNFVIDTTNRRVTCSSCGAVVDPYDALLEIAEKREEMEKQVQQLLNQKRQIASYKPHLTVIKEIEKRYRGRKMVPICPRCNEPFYFEEISSWSGKPYADARIKRFIESQKES